MLRPSRIAASGSVVLALLASIAAVAKAAENGDSSRLLACLDTRAAQLSHLEFRFEQDLHEGHARSSGLVRLTPEAVEHEVLMTGWTEPVRTFDDGRHIFTFKPRSSGARDPVVRSSKVVRGMVAPAQDLGIRFYAEGATLSIAAAARKYGFDIREMNAAERTTTFRIRSENLAVDYTVAFPGDGAVLSLAYFDRVRLVDGKAPIHRMRVTEFRNVDGVRLAVAARIEGYGPDGSIGDLPPAGRRDGPPRKLISHWKLDGFKTSASIDIAAVRRRFEPGNMTWFDADRSVVHFSKADREKMRDRAKAGAKKAKAGAAEVLAREPATAPPVTPWLTWRGVSAGFGVLALGVAALLGWRRRAG
jgi:hypothetical protein